MEAIRIISVAAAAAMFMACAKENIITPSSQELSPLTFNAVAAGSVSDDATKTVLSGNGLDVLWTAGDAISVCGAASAFTSDLSEGSSAETSFSGEALAADVYYAVYPYSAVKTWTGSTVTLELPADQVPALNTFADGLSICYASTSAEDMAFRFEHLLGYVKFTIDENSGAVSSVKISANGGESLAGAFTVAFSDGIPSVAVTEGSDEISMVADGAFPAGNYYFAMLPGTYAQGLTVTFSNAEGQTASKSMNTSLTLEAGKIQNIGTVARLDGISTDVNERVIWEGETVMGNWTDSNQELAWGKFDWHSIDLSQGQAFLVASLEQDPTSTYWNFEMLSASWKPFAEPVSMNLEPEQTEVKVELTSSRLSELQENDNGLIIRGSFYTLKKVTLVTESVYVSENTVWEGTHALLVKDWSNAINLSGTENVFQDIADGATIHVEYETSPDTDYWQLQFNDSNWDMLTSIPEVEGLTAGSVHTSHLLNDVDIASVRTSGMILNGYGVIVKRIYWTE